MAYQLTDAKILRVNLSTGDIKQEDVDQDLLKKYLGGRGLGSKLFSDEVSPDTDPFSADNKLLDENGELKRGTIILVNGHNILHLEKLATPVKDGDIVALFPPGGGG